MFYEVRVGILLFRFQCTDNLVKLNEYRKGARIQRNEPQQSNKIRKKEIVQPERIPSKPIIVSPRHHHHHNNNNDHIQHSPRAPSVASKVNPSIHTVTIAPAPIRTIPTTQGFLNVNRQLQQQQQSSHSNSPIQLPNHQSQKVPKLRNLPSNSTPQHQNHQQIQHTTNPQVKNRFVPGMVHSVDFPHPSAVAHSPRDSVAYSPRALFASSSPSFTAARPPSPSESNFPFSLPNNNEFGTSHIHSFQPSFQNQPHIQPTQRLAVPTNTDGQRRNITNDQQQQQQHYNTSTQVDLASPREPVSNRVTVKVNWFVRHRGWMSQRWIRKYIAISILFNLIIVAILVGTTPSLHEWIPDVSADSCRAFQVPPMAYIWSWSLLHIAIMIICLYSISQFPMDGFNMKKELYGTAVIGIIAMIVAGLVPEFLNDQTAVFPVGTFLRILFPLLCTTVSILHPIATSINQDSSPLYLHGSITCLEDLLASRSGFASFFNFLKTEFNMESLLFWKAVAHFQHSIAEKRYLAVGHESLTHSHSNHQQQQISMHQSGAAAISMGNKTTLQKRLQKKSENKKT